MTNESMNLNQVKDMKLCNLFYECEIKSIIKACEIEGYKSIEDFFAKHIMTTLKKYR